MERYKPSYFKFLKHQLFFRQKPFNGENNFKYHESKQTKKITFILTLGLILIMAILSTDHVISKLSWAIKLIIIFVFGLGLESVHWFYAKFVEEVEN